MRSAGLRFTDATRAEPRRRARPRRGLDGGGVARRSRGVPSAAATAGTRRAPAVERKVELSLESFTSSAPRARPTSADRSSRIVSSGQESPGSLLPKRRSDSSGAAGQSPDRRMLSRSSGRRRRAVRRRGPADHLGQGVACRPRTGRRRSVHRSVRRLRGGDRISRSCSPRRVPPGSRVTTTGCRLPGGVPPTAPPGSSCPTRPAFDRDEPASFARHVPSEPLSLIRPSARRACPPDAPTVPTGCTHGGRAIAKSTLADSSRRPAWFASGLVAASAPARSSSTARTISTHPASRRTRTDITDSDVFARRVDAGRPQRRPLMSPADQDRSRLCTRALPVPNRYQR